MLPFSIEVVTFVRAETALQEGHGETLGFCVFAIYAYIYESYMMLYGYHYIHIYIYS